jgi:hypothetical protein
MPAGSRGATQTVAPPCPFDGEMLFLFKVIINRELHVVSVRPARAPAASRRIGGILVSQRMRQPYENQSPIMIDHKYVTSFRKIDTLLIISCHYENVIIMEKSAYGEATLKQSIGETEKLPGAVVCRSAQPLLREP